MMIKLSRAGLLGFLFFFIGCQPRLSAAECELTNKALESMPMVEVSFYRADQSSFSIKARLANDVYTRAAGFQRVCAETIAETPILFLFDRVQRPSFHMNNVVAPIDIAFIKESGEIDVIRNMKPYSVVLKSKRYYSSTKPVIAALEVRKGFYVDNKLQAQDRIEWNIDLLE